MTVPAPSPNVVMLPSKVARDLETLLGLGTDRCRHCKHYDYFMHDPERGYCDKRPGNGRNRFIVHAGETCHRFEQRR